MELVALLKILTAGIKTQQALMDLVEGQMYQILIEIGDNQYYAALSALKDMKSSGRPERELESAITNLRSAYQAYDSQSTNSVLRYGLIHAGYGPKEHKKACEAACLIAACYIYLGERELARKYIDFSKHHFERYESETLEIERKKRNTAYSAGSAIFASLTEWWSPMAEMERRIKDEKTKHEE